METAQLLLNNVIPYLIAGGILSPVAFAINKLIKAQKPLTKWAVVVIGAAVGALLNAFLTTKSVDANVVAVQTAITTFLASSWWLVLFKPLFTWLGAQFAKASAYDAQLKSAVEETPTV